MRFIEKDHVLKFSVKMRILTPLLLSSGNSGEFADSELEKTPEADPRLHVNGYVWASLLRRAMIRLTGDTAYKETAATVAARIGDYTPNSDRLGVSSFWFESSLCPIINSDIRPGIKIDRKYGVTTKTGLYNEEHLSPGHSLLMNFNVFCTHDEVTPYREAILAALKIIDDGIESIGGGWSYGLGRLAVDMVGQTCLDLKVAEDRKKIFTFDLPWETPSESISIDRQGYCKIHVEARIPPGQLFAISSGVLPLQTNMNDRPFDAMPDAFVYSHVMIRKNERGEDEQYTEFVVPGKAIRQGLFSVQIERALRSGRTSEKNIKHMMNKWFGSTDKRGEVAVTDAVVHDAVPEILHRIQLCEHTFQNNNLFSEEYLKQGSFSFDIFLDPVDDVLKGKILQILDELIPEGSREKKDKDTDNGQNGVSSVQKSPAAPPGWYRLGASSTSTGQFEVIDYRVFDTFSADMEQLTEQKQKEIGVHG